MPSICCWGRRCRRDPRCRRRMTTAAPAPPRRWRRWRRAGPGSRRSGVGPPAERRAVVAAGGRGRHRGRGLLHARGLRAAVLGARQRLRGCGVVDRAGGVVVRHREPLRGRGGLAASPGLDRLGHLERARVAGRGIALERQPHGVVELRRDIGPVVRDRRDRVLLLLERQLRERGVLVRQPPGEELVRAHAQRVDVRRRPRLLAACLLRRQVRGRAEHRADLGDARLLGRLGDPEVRELGGAHLLGRTAGCPASRLGARHPRGARSRGRGRRRAPA